jgi:stage III sporulation protein AG
MSEFLEKIKSGSSKKLIENLVIFLILVIIVMIVMNTMFFENKSNNTESYQVAKTIETSKIDGLETKLKYILSKIDGAGNVEVMISYFSGEEEVPMFNISEGTTVTNEKDTNGGERKIEQKDYEKTIVFKEEGSSKLPIIQKNIMPEVTGVIVVADGAKNITVKDNLIKAIEATVNIPSHRIQVFQKQKI